MKDPRHGKATFRWCDRCGVPLLGERCDVCGARGREFQVSLPGDIRPCFGAGVDTVKALFQEHFGTSAFLDGRLILLNKVAGEDRADEIVVEGNVIGVMRYDLRDNRFHLDLRLPGALMLVDIARKGVVVIEPRGGHLKGKNVTRGELTEGEFSKDSPLIVRSRGKVCSGVGRRDPSTASPAERVLKVRDVGSGVIPLRKRELDWKDFVNANTQHLISIESRAVSDIRSFLSKKKRTVTVSFSGGKDSLAAYGLARRALDDLELIFVDTGLEFPETVEYVRGFALANDETLHVAEAKNAFWENVDAFGPPAKDFRWCCKVCKLAPLTELIGREFPRGTVTIEGNRAYESFARARIGFVERNPFVPNQTILNPVRDWRALDIWGYIWFRRLRYNPLYERDKERIGCYLCASCLASEWDSVGESHPRLHRRWEEALREWAERNGLPAEYVEHGLWRWKVLPPKMRRLAEELDIPLVKGRSDSFSLRMMKGASPCAAGGYSIEAVAHVPRHRDFVTVAECLKVMGKVSYSPDFEIAMVKDRGRTAKLFGGGQVSVVAPDGSEAKEYFERAVKALLRSQLCTECGICVKACPRGAITLRDGPRIDERRCVQCGRCEKACVVTHYYDKLMEEGV